MKKTFKKILNIFVIFIKKTLFSRKGITWAFSQYLISQQFKLIKLKVVNRIAVSIYDLGILAILYTAGLIALGLIVFEKINIGLNYGKNNK